MGVQELNGAWWVVVGVVLGGVGVMGCHSVFLRAGVRVGSWVFGYWEGLGVWLRIFS